MALMESVMMDLGTQAPDFFLPNVQAGENVGLYDILGASGLLVMFLSRHCPYVQHVKKQDHQPYKGLRRQSTFCCYFP